MPFPYTTLFRSNGDLKQKLTVEAKGEIAALADTINSMIDTLATFADQVTTVAREVGVEGQLGGQAKVPGAAGTWKGLTENRSEEHTSELQSHSDRCPFPTRRSSDLTATSSRSSPSRPRAKSPPWPTPSTA